MNFVLLLILLLTCLLLIGWGIRRRDGMYQFPFLAGATFLGFVVPQMVGLRFDPDLPSGGLEKAFYMTILCAGMCYVGYSWKNNPMQFFNWDFEEKKLLQVSTILTVVGAYFFFSITRLPEEMTSATRWSGTTVAYLFFAQVLTYGFAIAVLIYFRSKSIWALFLAVFGSLFYLDRIIVAGRRGVALEFAFILIISWWFGKKRLLPRAMVLAAIVLGTLALYSTGDYRSMAQERNGLEWKNVRTIPFAENFLKLMTQGGEEMRNAVYMIEATDRTADFDWGVFHWNTLIFNFVPAQIVGEEFKSSLMVSTLNIAEEVFGFEESKGSTITGMVDAFRSFWYLGCLKFFLIALVMKKVYSSAQAGSTMFQLLYMIVLMPSLHSITHHTQWFVTPWVHMCIFLLPGLYFARKAQPLAEVTSRAFERKHIEVVQNYEKSCNHL